MWTTDPKTACLVFAMVLVSDRMAHAQCAGYKIDYLHGYDCGILGYSGVGFQDINDSGNACGGIGYCGAGADMIIWNGEDLLLKYAPLNLTALSINQHNDLAGVQQLPLENRGFVYQDGEYHMLNPLPGHGWSEAYAISNDGTVVGYSNGTGEFWAVTWKNLIPAVLQVPIGPKSLARDISDNSNFICGWMGVGPHPNFGSSAFLWHNGKKVVDLGFLPGTTAMDARGVNNFGQVCGIAFAPRGRTGITRSGFFWSDGVLQDIGIVPGYTQCYVFDINDLGQIVGYSENDDGVGKAFVWQNGVMQALQALIPAELELDLSLVWSINNLGQIVGYAGSKEWSQVGVILTPIPTTPGDFNCNKIVDVDDLLGVLNSWGFEGTTTADFNQDKIVDVCDLLIVIDNWTM